MAGTVRYWNGTEWTQSVAPAQPSAAVPTRSSPAHAYRAIAIVIMAVGAIVAVVGLIMVLSSPSLADCSMDTMGISEYSDCRDEGQASSTVSVPTFLIGLGIVAVGGLVMWLKPKELTGTGAS